MGVPNLLAAHQSTVVAGSRLDEHIVQAGRAGAAARARLGARGGTVLTTAAVRRVVGALTGGVCVADLDAVVAIDTRTVALAGVLDGLSSDEPGRMLCLAILVDHARRVARLSGQLARGFLAGRGLLTD